MTYRRTITIEDTLYKKINIMRGEIMSETLKNNTFTQVVNAALEIGLEQKDRLKEMIFKK